MSGFLKEAKTVFILVELYDMARFHESNAGYFRELNNMKEALSTDTEFAHLIDCHRSSSFLSMVNSDEWKTIQRQIDKVFHQHGGYDALFSFDIEELNIMWEKVGKILQEQGGYNGLWDGKSLSILHRLAFYATNFFAYFGFKSLLQGTFGQLSLNPVTACICGGLSTLVATFVSHPLDTLRTRVETQTSRHHDGARAIYGKICRDGHFRSLYAGLLPSLLSNILSMTMTVTFYESLTTAWRGIRLNDYRFTTSLVSSILASLAASTATFPMEVVKRRMQMEGKEESNNLKAIGEKYKEIVEKDGVGGLYRGIQPHCFKVVVDNALSFVTYEIIRLPCCLATIGFGFMFNLHELYE
ncbi:Probable envelope ADP,ATP carrier protein, chloroplastic [Linum grandiflorum]